MKRRIVLLDERHLAMQRELIEGERVRTLGEEVGIDAIMAELIIDADTNACIARLE